MNDRAVSLLENYDIEVLRTGKGRGAILCETNHGTMIFKEYTGPKDKLRIQQDLLSQIARCGYVPVEQLQATKEGELFVCDNSGVTYILKSYFNGRECNIHDMEECLEAVRTLAGLHNVMILTGHESISNMPVFYLEKEYEKHNRELKKVKSFLKAKGQKSNFELFLLHEYDYFLEQAFEVTEEWISYSHLTDSDNVKEQGIFCHGDYQYHNIIKIPSDMAIINFEKCLMDDPVRDLYLFMRKLLEKNNWSIQLGESILEEYSKIRPLSARSYLNLYYRFAYPEKFWKIVNFYFNSRKVWIPEKNSEKLEKLIVQEKQKQEFLDSIFRNLS